MANILDHKFAESDFVGKGASSLPNRPREAGMDGAAVKAVLDNIGKVMIALGKHNDLIDNLFSTTDGNSGADSIGVTAIPGVTGATTQAVLESLKALIDATVIDQIPDNSLANAKLATDAKVGSLAALATTEKGSTVGAINELNGLISTHEAKKSTAAILGHILAGSGVSIDANGVLSAPIIKVGSFTRDTSLASGSQAITGIGFTPRLVLFIGGGNLTNEMTIGFQIAGGSAYVVASQHASAAGTWAVTGSVPLFLAQGTGITYIGVISSYDADGFTVSWTKTGAKTGTREIYYLAIK